MATIYIIRGTPESGKSTLARKLVLVDASRHCETDLYFMKKGEYFFDATKLREADAWCQGEVRRLMREQSDGEVSITFTERWEYQPYLEMASEFGFDIQVLDCFGDWSNVHHVPESVISAMLNRWEPHRTANDRSFHRQAQE